MEVESSVSYEKACRLCLSTSGETQPIFTSGSEDQTGSPLLVEKIQECVDVEISESDGLPTQICTRCSNNVNNWHTFKRIANYSQGKLKQWYNGDNEEFDPKDDPMEDGENEDITIDASYPEVQLLEKVSESKLQPEGPPILASLGLAPRNEKDEGEEEDEGESVGEPAKEEVVRKSVKKAFRPNRPLPAMQMASKSCLVCGREYRYSHNARRHELISHNYDRYSNKVMSSNKAFSKLKPNPFNLKARMLQNPINQRVLPSMPKATPKVSKGEPYPVRIRSLVDLQSNKQPEILKSLLTRKPELVVTEPEIMRSSSASPETLISEPELAAYHVETIISEPDAFENQSEGSDNEGGDDRNYQNSTAEGDSEEEAEESSNVDVNKIIGVNGQSSGMRGRKGSVEHITPDDHQYGSGDEGADPEGQYDDDEKIEENDGDDGKEDTNMDETGENSQEGEGETYNEIDVDEHEIEDPQGNSYYDDDDDMPPLAPVVEINEGQQPDADNTNEDNEEEGQDMMEAEDVKVPQEPEQERPLTMTPTQKAFIIKYKDVIEQINTLMCKCCNRVHPRRKALIQHLQKTGQRIPKHTCYNCVITFTHIGALLSHMRANACTDLWKIVLEDGEIPDEMVSENPTAAVAVNKQYKDVLNARSYFCKLCSAKYQLKQMIMKHIIEVHENGGQRIPLCCIHCKYRFKDNKLWKKHVRNGECSVYISCDLCNEKFRTLMQFTEHAIRLHTGEDRLDQSAEGLSKSIDGRPTDCHICQKSHGSYHNLVKHLKTVHNEEQPHMCQHCDSKFAHVNDLNNHIMEEHWDRANGVKSEAEHSQGEVDLSIVKQEEVTTYNYSCTDCDAIFDSVDGWTQHQIDVHNHTAYECDMCDKKYLQDSELAQHKNEHLKVRFYSCTLCSNSYSSGQSLSEHMLESHPGEAVSSENPFFCEMCSRSFKNRQAFSNHMRIHTNIPTHNKKPGEATVSAKKPPPQKFLNMLQRNSPKSMMTAPYACDICGKGFLHKKNIWKHKKVLHPEEARLIELEKTGAHFLNNSLNIQASQNNSADSSGISIPQFDSFTTAVYEQPVHEYHNASMSAPSGEKPVYQCDLCDKTFTVKSSIWKHKRVKHGIVNPQIQLDGSGNETSKISCSICKINFSDKESYQRHKKTVHSVGCKICGMALGSTLQLYQHYKAAHAKELLGYNASQGDEIEESREASDEGEDNMDDDENPENKYQARYPCGDCGRTFVGMTALQEHDCQDPSSSQTYDCEICNKSYTSISALKSHRGWHLRSPDGKAAMNSSGLWMPAKQPNKVSKFEVRDAQQIKHSTPILDHLEIKRKLPPDVQMTLLKKKKLNDEVSLSLVSKKVSSEDSKTCEPCGKQFCSKAGFLRHMEEVHKPNSIFCPLCSKSFTRKSTLLIHMRKHGIVTDGALSGESGGESTPIVQKEVEKLYACDMCNVRYTTSKSLRRHRLKHHSGGQSGLEIRPTPNSIVGTRVVEVGGPSRHKCNQCGETFPTEKDMWQHTHYACEQCPMVFSKQQYLNSHVRSKHPEAAASQFFPCSMCDRFYTNKKLLQQHIEMSH